MKGVESELARLARRSEHPDRKRGRRVNPLSLAVPDAEGAMQRIIPAEFILTSAAIAEMLGRDAEWLRLKNLRYQSGRRHGAEWTAMGNRAAELQAGLLDNVASGFPPALIVKATDAGEWQALPLPPGYWADVVPSSAALIKGAVVAGKLHDNDIRRFEGDALCFRRSEWNVWLARFGTRLKRWTVPQAAVWIRTRDDTAVESLGERERKCLPLAAMAIEDMTEGASAIAASGCLATALQRGRLGATGRRAQLEMVDGMEEPQPWILETDDERIPDEFWKAGNFLPSIGDEGDSAAVPGERARWLRVTVLADDCIRLWPHPSSFLTREPTPIGAAVADLMTEPAERLGWLLIRSDVTVTCLNAEGERVPMDRGIFRTSNFTIDNTANSVSADGRRWVSVMVGLAPADRLDVTMERVGNAIFDGKHKWTHTTELDQQSVNVWMRERFNSWPDDKVPPDRYEDRDAAKAHFTATGYRFREIDKMVRVARKAEAEPWTRSGPNGSQRKTRKG
jgi:hypothetical protein